MLPFSVLISVTMSDIYAFIQMHQMANERKPEDLASSVSDSFFICCIIFILCISYAFLNYEIVCQYLKWKCDQI